MNIAHASHKSKVSAKRIRHYDSIGLLGQLSRSDTGYRQFSEVDIQNLIFIRHARDAGFSMQAIKALLGLWRNKRRSSSEVKRVAARHLASIETKIKELAAIRESLRQLVNTCHGDHRSECPILDGLQAGVITPSFTLNAEKAKPTECPKRFPSN